MESIFKTWKRSRQLHADFFERHTIEQLNKIPEGFNNNLIWNIGHIIVAQQSLIYKTSNLPIWIGEDLLNRYKPGTKPTGDVSKGEVDSLRHLLMSLVDQTEKDFNNGRFITFTERTTATGFHLANLTEAFQFNNYHEGLHLGYMMSLRKFV